MTVAHASACRVDTRVDVWRPSAQGRAATQTRQDSQPPRLSPPLRVSAIRAKTAFLALLPLLTSCGYHIAGKGDLMPKTVKTVSIQPFGNRTQLYKLARLLPADIGRELISRTRYRLIDDANQADAVLTGTLVNSFAYPTVTDPNTSRATTVQIITIVQFTLTERATGKVLFTNPGLEIRERYEVASDPKAYFDESGTAQERVSKDVARTVISTILEAF